MATVPYDGSKYLFFYFVVLFYAHGNKTLVFPHVYLLSVQVSVCCYGKHRYHTCTKSILIVSSKLCKHKLKKAYLAVLMAQALRTLEGTLIKELGFFQKCSLSTKTPSN